MKKMKRKPKAIAKGSQVAKKVNRVFSIRDHNLCLLNPAGRIPKQDFFVCYNSYRSDGD
jgi:hypothetical protein